MDYEAVNSAPQELFIELGLTAKGDIYALKGFCEMKAKRTERKEKMKSLLDKLSSKNTASKGKGKKVASSTGNLKKDQKRKVSLGWNHYSLDRERYVNVRLSNGGGSREVSLQSDATKEKVMNVAKNLFFPQGASAFGKASQMQFDLGNFRNEIITSLIDEEGKEHPFSVQRYFDVNKLSKARIYLLSRPRLTVDVSKDEDDSSDSDLPFGLKSKVENHQGRSSKENEKGCKRKSKQQECKLSAVEGMQQEHLETLQAIRASRVPAECESDPVLVGVRHPSLGLIQRKFSETEEMTAVYDWCGSLARYPEYFSLSHLPGETILPTENVGLYNGCLLNVAEQSQPVPLAMDENEVWFKGFGPDNRILACQFPETFMEGDDTLDEIIPLDLNGASEEHPQRSYDDRNHAFQGNRGSSTITSASVMPNDNNPSTSAAGHETLTSAEEIQPRKTRVIDIHRLTVRQDLIKVFSDSSIIDDNVEINMINSRGEFETGIGIGVARDAFSLFWSDVCDSLMQGEGERVPYIRHDFQRLQWEAIGRVLVVGFRCCHYFPLMLSKTFMTHCLFGENVITQDMLMKSFRQYVSESERSVIDKCLKSDDLDENDEDLQEFLCSYDCKKLPNKENIRQIINEVAHQELIQRPEYVANCWREVISPLRAYFITPESLDQFYERLVPNTSKVVNSLQAECKSDAERECLKYLKKYIRGLEHSKLTKFLKFVTGSELMIFDRIEVTFNQLEKAGRRPVAHTCNFLLEVPATYQSYPEMREEFNSILSANSWEIDIV